MNAKGLGQGGCCQWRLGPPAGECLSSWGPRRESRVVKTWPGLRISPLPLTTSVIPGVQCLHLKNGDRDSPCLRGLLRLKTDNVGKALKTVLWW